MFSSIHYTYNTRTVCTGRCVNYSLSPYWERVTEGKQRGYVDSKDLLRCSRHAFFFPTTWEGRNSRESCCLVARPLTRQYAHCVSFCSRKNDAETQTRSRSGPSGLSRDELPRKYAYLDFPVDFDRFTRLWIVSSGAVIGDSKGKA